MDAGGDAVESLRGAGAVGVPVKFLVAVELSDDFFEFVFEGVDLGAEDVIVGASADVVVTVAFFDAVDGLIGPVAGDFEIGAGEAGEGDVFAGLIGVGNLAANAFVLVESREFGGDAFYDFEVGNIIRIFGEVIIACKVAKVEIVYSGISSL